MSIAVAEARPPYVTFEVRAEEDRAKTIETGVYSVKNVDYAIITPQGSKDRIERLVAEWFPQLEQQVREDRFSSVWLDGFRNRYRIWKEGNEIPENGHPIVNWPAASPAQVKTLLAGGVRTIEDLAAANEEVLARLGMGARALKNRAVEWMAAAGGPGAKAEEVAALKQQNADLQLRVDSLTEQLEKLAPLLAKLDLPQTTGVDAKVPNSGASKL